MGRALALERRPCRTLDGQGERGRKQTASYEAVLDLLRRYLPWR